MKIAFDIGGVISKYPDELITLISEFNDEYTLTEPCIITDQHPKEEVLKVLKDNHLYDKRWFNEDNVYCADYKKYGEMCKAVLLRDLKIDIFIDDFAGYLNWDYSWGKPPLRLLVWPDASRPYHDKSWVQPTHNFGSEYYKLNDKEV